MTESDPRQQTGRTRLPAAASPDHADSAAFEGFYRDTVIPLTRFLMLQGASVADATEIAHDTLASAYTRWHSLDYPRAWSYRVASKAWVRRVSSIREDPTAEPAEPNPLLGATPTNSWHFRQDLITALAELPPRQRQAMAWTFSGYTPAEIATELNLPAEQVRSNLRLARRALAARHTDGQETT